MMELVIFIIIVIKFEWAKKYGLIYPDLKLVPELKYDHFEEFEDEEGFFFFG